MKQPTSEYLRHLICIDCIALFFWNHSGDDIAKLRRENSNIDHVWKMYIEPSSNTYDAFWRSWITNLTNESKMIILNTALDKYAMSTK
jgi:hypothetical protein